jgi:hypothetical protein
VGTEWLGATGTLIDLFPLDITQFRYNLYEPESRATGVHRSKQTRNAPKGCGKQQKPPAHTGSARYFKHLNMGVLIEITRPRSKKWPVKPDKFSKSKLRAMGY